MPVHLRLVCTPGPMPVVLPCSHHQQGCHSCCCGSRVGRQHPSAGASSCPDVTPSGGPCLQFWMCGAMRHTQVGCPHTPLMLYQQAVSCNGRLVVAVSIMTNKVIGVACMHMRTVLRDWSVRVCVVSSSETTVGYHSAGSAGFAVAGSNCTYRL